MEKVNFNVSNSELNFELICLIHNLMLFSFSVLFLSYTIKHFVPTPYLRHFLVIGPEIML